MTKEDILNEIRRTAKENSGIPLGKDRFAKETGIRPYDWGKYWARFSDAHKEAGFTPNQLKISHSEEFLFEKVIGLIRKLGKFPTSLEIRVEKNTDDKFPDSSILFRRFGSKQGLIQKISGYCKTQGDCADVIQICEPLLKESNEQEDSDAGLVQTLGEVYLFKSGKYYKIGKTNDTVRRGSELRIQLPENLNLIHSIKTDDPSGIETYWHKRFEPKRMNGEWFDLTSSEVKAFRAWKRIA